MHVYCQKDCSMYAQVSQFLIHTVYGLERHYARFYLFFTQLLMLLIRYDTVLRGFNLVLIFHKVHRPAKDLVTKM